MEFFTIGQYFNRLYSILLFILIIPILAFGLLYLIADRPGFFSFAEDQLYFWYAIVFIDWAFIFVLFNKKIKIIRHRPGLGHKLHQYFRLTIVRYTLGSSGGILLAIGYYFSQEESLTILFMVTLLLMSILWPRPAKVCADLQLRGDEREMVYFRKDEF